MEPIKEEKLQEQTKILFLEIEGREPGPSDGNLMALLKRGINHGYKMGYDKYYTPLCDKCNFNMATCFGPGAYCSECSMEEIEAGNI